MEDFTLVQLEYFSVVAETGSMTAAAAKLNVAQSTLSSAISALEQRFGTELLHRIPRTGVAPTVAGLRLLGSARRLLDDAAGLHAAVRGDDDGTVTGRIRLAVYTPLAPIYAPRIVELVERRHPGLEVSIVEGDNHQLWSLLFHGEAEFALSYDIALGDDWAIEPLRDIPPHAIVAPTHPLAQTPGRRIHLEELVSEPAVLLDIPAALHHYLGYFRSLGLEPRVRHTAQSYETVRAYVAAGLGYSILNHRYDSTAQGGAVVALPIADSLTPARLSIISRRDAAVSGRSAVCRAAIREIVDTAEATVA